MTGGSGMTAKSVVTTYETVVQSASPMVPGSAVLTPLGGGGGGGGGSLGAGKATPALRGVSAQGRERAAAAAAAAAASQLARPDTTDTGGGGAMDSGTSYIALMETLRQYPNSTEFVYLSRVDMSKDSTNYNPYALEMVPFNAADPNDFYTMSVHGITHFVDGSNADFTTLDQWEREFQLFNAMRQLNVFKRFRKWKGFSVWRGTVRSTKIRRAQTVLEKTLFQLNPVFQKSITEVRRLCFDLSYLRLSKLKIGQLCTLDEFVNAQRDVREEVIDKLAAFGTTTIATVDEACQAALDALEQRLNDFYGKSGGEITEMAPAAGTAGESAQYAYTVAAARRSEQRKLLCFVKMTDYMICDTLHEVLIESVSDILKATGQCPKEDFEMPLPPYRLKKVAGARWGCCTVQLLNAVDP
jgi:dynein heavy chain